MARSRSTLAFADRPATIALPLLILLVAGVYLLLHPYQGLVHDSRLYTLQALNHLHPELYGNDLFLRYGSQDSYTFFTPLYASAISLLGVESAASLLTAASVIAVLCAAWALARTMMSPALAWLGLTLLVLIPGFYGSGLTFAVLEEFLTPRLLAEALVLLALTMWLKSHWQLCSVLLLAAALIHPIMTLPAIMVIASAAALAHWRVLWPVATVALVVSVVAMTVPLPLERWQFDEVWRPIAEWAPHLMLAEWSIHDWARNVTISATLLFGVLTLPDTGRRMTSAVLLTVGATLLLSWIGGDVLKLAIVVQGQAWRSLWLATALATLLLPVIGHYCWTGTPLQRAAWLLLVSAWLAGAWSLSLFFSVPAVVAMAAGRINLPQPIAHLALRVSVVILGVLVVCMFAMAWSEHAARQATVPVSWLSTLRLDGGGTLPLAVVLLPAWFLLARLKSPRSAALGWVLLAAVVMPLGVLSLRDWRREQYPAETRLAYASWRALIPQGADVLWSAEAIPGSDPMAVWLLLQRPSYYSSVQGNSGLFSRAAAVEIARRRRAIPLSLPTESALKIHINSQRAHALACKDVPARYIVTDLSIEGSRTVAAPLAAQSPFDRLSLHVCG